MATKNERGEEARKYFIACEQGLKIATRKLQSVQIDEKLSESLAQVVTTLASVNERLTKLEDSTVSSQTENI